MREIFKDRRVIGVGIALALAGYAFGEHDKDEPEPVLIPGVSAEVTKGDETYNIRYYDNGTRSVTILDAADKIKLLFRQRCEDYFLSDEFLWTDVLEPAVEKPSGDADFDLQYSISNDSGKCDDERLTPGEYGPEELGVDY